MQNEKFANLAAYAPVAVRIGISLVFLWFGYSQLSNPQAWTGLLPGWTEALPFEPAALIQMNGVFEVVFGGLLLLGLYVRPVALLLALHMFNIVFTVGYNGIGVRDFGLAMATTAIFLYGADRFSLSSFLRGHGSL